MQKFLQLWKASFKKSVINIHALILFYEKLAILCSKIEIFMFLKQQNWLYQYPWLHVTLNKRVSNVPYQECK